MAASSTPKTKPTDSSSTSGNTISTSPVPRSTAKTELQSDIMTASTPMVEEDAPAQTPVDAYSPDDEESDDDHIVAEPYSSDDDSDDHRTARQPYFDDDVRLGSGDDEGRPYHEHSVWHFHGADSSEQVQHYVQLVEVPQGGQAAVFQQGPPDYEPVPTPGDQRALVYLSLGEVVSGGQCSICVDEMYGTEKSIARISTCSHDFHSECITEWLKARNTCPLCRGKVEVGRSRRR